MTLEEKFGRTADGYIQLAMSRQDLASFVGTSYETLFRVLNELAGDGAIETNGKEIKITGGALLQQLITS